MDQEMSEHNSWGLSDEIRYIERIGQHSSGTKDIPRSELLKNYLHAQLRRSRWGDLDRQQAIKLSFEALQKATYKEISDVSL